MSDPIHIGNATLHLGDCLAGLPLPDGSVHCCVTSPPYWNQRNYGVAGQLGLERTPDEYVEHMVAVFRHVRRVLRDDGTLWLNLGDCFAGARGGKQGKQGKCADRSAAAQDVRVRDTDRLAPGLKSKDLVGMPWRVAFALQADGWYLRSDIIWAKPNPMPESVRDRPTRAHEYLFLFAKSERYFYDADAIREPLRPKTFTTFGTVSRSKGNDAGGFVKSDNYRRDVPERKPRLNDAGEPAGANKRSVWTIAPEPIAEEHFAAFPTALVEPCIKAGTSEFGCCDKCGAPRVRLVERTPMVVRESKRSGKAREASTNGRTVYSGTMVQAPSSRTVGCGCGCGCGCGPCTVLDPFNGSGTTGITALRLGRRYVGVELNPDYLAMSERRLRAATAQADLFRRPA